MNATLTHTWLDINQRALSAALAVVRGYLSRHIARTQGEAAVCEATSHIEAARQQYRDVADSASPPTALDTLCALFGLSPFARDILLMCAGIELDSTFTPLCAAAQGDPQRAFPTFSLALAALPDAHWSALAPDAPLRHWRLIEVAAAGGPSYAPLTTRPLRLDERVLHYLTGVQHLDEGLAALIEPVHPSQELMPTHQAIAQRIVAMWSRAAGTVPLPVIILYGPDALSARAIAVSACASLGLSVHTVQAHAVPSSPGDLHTFIRLWEREAALHASALLVDCDDDEMMDANREGSVNALIERAHTALFVTSRERRRVKHRQGVSFEVHRPTTGEQRAVWHAVLGNWAQRLDGQLDVLTSQFSLNTPAIYAAVTEANIRQETELCFDMLWDACRNHTRSRLNELAQPVASAVTWDDLVLPKGQKGILHDIVAHVRQRAKVYEAWGFGAKGARGLGISALLAGPSGTGKTLAAEVLANALRLDLYRIDLSAVVSKYIGETEKNLRRIFDVAEEGGAILLFDEADALFGKRSEVKDSHDRYANIEVSYLLQRMECYRGLAILTTNLKSALDTAFLRRIRFVVQFPFPDATQRAEIWRRIFPASTPTEGLDVSKLAQLNVAGGNIRNIALSAAFLAADVGKPVRMGHLLHAARSEYSKLEKPLTDTEIAGWA
jgi:hypothetical protein